MTHNTSNIKTASPHKKCILVWCKSSLLNIHIRLFLFLWIALNIIIDKCFHSSLLLLIQICIRNVNNINKSLSCEHVGVGNVAECEYVNWLVLKVFLRDSFEWVYPAFIPGSGWADVQAVK